jgi:hypothetical protein
LIPEPWPQIVFMALACYAMPGMFIIMEIRRKTSYEITRLWLKWALLPTTALFIFIALELLKHPQEFWGMA